MHVGRLAGSRLVIVRVFWGTVVACVVLTATVGCSAATSSVTSAPPISSSGEPSAPAGAEAVVVSVIDGDTLETSAGTVRIIGIDAPERGECGYDDAASYASGLLAAGDTVTLTLPDGENPEDTYGRLLRYVDTVQGVDVASSLLAAGVVVARFDSTDGYPWHPREAEYRAAQTAVLGDAGTVMTVACKAAADAAEQARIAAEQQPAQEAAIQPLPAVDGWWKQYTSCTKLKKNPNGHPTGPFSRDNPGEAAIYDWFANGTGNNGDGEGDGLACE